MTWNTVEVSFATLETHVLGDNRLPMCQCHQTDSRTIVAATSVSQIYNLA